MPFLLLFSAFGLLQLSKSLSSTVLKLIITAILLVNGYMSYYLTTYHESGVIKVTEVLRDQILSDYSTAHKEIEVGFLTPCHSTPYQSYFDLPSDVSNIWFLTCEPPLHLTSADELDNYMDESDLFYDDPIGYLNANFVNQTGEFVRDWPDYLVIFEHIDLTLNDYIVDHGYHVNQTLFNTVAHWDYRRAGDLIIYAKDLATDEEV
ncbi:unnamed protein product [Ambrosiozyma monospora]|uniref:Unnamed protein product n=1 Tax=Ambrosiozyma monospora TaxID=43982 RepID=A0ACB5T4H7_AMBMO|nr:unnamed protein product [Ambrosiozyma monospora]